MSATDLPSTTTSITVNGTTKGVFRYGSGPDKLVQLEKKIDEITGTDIWTKEVAVPRDFAVTYSFGVGLDYTLDTSKELFSVKMCNGPMQHATLALSDQELYSIWKAVNENGFFSLSDFTEECPNSAPTCVGIEPETRSVLTVSANGQTNEVEFRESYELNHGAPQGSDFAKFKNVVSVIESMLSQHVLPRSSYAYL